VNAPIRLDYEIENLRLEIAIADSRSGLLLKMKHYIDKELSLRGLL
jgi:hypothetical protein